MAAAMQASTRRCRAIVPKAVIPAEPARWPWVRHAVMIGARTPPTKDRSTLQAPAMRSDGPSRKASCLTARCSTTAFACSARPGSTSLSPAIRRRAFDSFKFRANRAMAGDVSGIDPIIREPTRSWWTAALTSAPTPRSRCCAGSRLVMDKRGPGRAAPDPDWLYDRIARNRYRCSPHRDCMIPAPAWRDTSFRSPTQDRPWLSPARRVLSSEAPDVRRAIGRGPSRHHGLRHRYRAPGRAPGASIARIGPHGDARRAGSDVSLPCSGHRRRHARPLERERAFAVVDAAGPFQRGSYRLARARSRWTALHRSGGRPDFVAGFGALDDARRRRRVALAGRVRPRSVQSV